MTPAARLATWLGCIAGAAALAWAATALRVDAAMPPTQTRLQPMPPMPAPHAELVSAAVAPIEAALSPATSASEPQRP